MKNKIKINTEEKENQTNNLALKQEEIDIKKILLAENYVTPEDIAKAEKYAKDNQVSITDYLFNEGILTKDLFGQAMAEFFKVEYSDLNSYLPEKKQVLLISEEVARKFMVVVFKQNEKEIIIATNNPNQSGIVETLKQIFPKQKIILSYSLLEDIEEAFVYYRKTLETRFGKIIKEEGRVIPQIIDEIFKIL